MLSDLAASAAGAASRATRRRAIIAAGHVSLQNRDFAEERIERKRSKRLRSRRAGPALADQSPLPATSVDTVEYTDALPKLAHGMFLHFLVLYFEVDGRSSEASEASGAPERDCIFSGMKSRKYVQFLRKLHRLFDEPWVNEVTQHYPGHLI